MFVLQIIINGLLVGGIYALIATSLVLIYKATRVFNFAIGEFLLIGPLFSWGFAEWLNLDPVVSLVLGLCVAFPIALLINRLVMNRFVAQPVLVSIMATLGLSILLRGIGLFVLGGTEYALHKGLALRNVAHLQNLTVSHELLRGFITAIIIVCLLVFFLRRTNIGLQMRSTADDQQLAQSTGIRVKAIFSLSWGISALVAAMAGIIIALRLGFSVVMTPEMAFKAFPAVIFGGLESIPGALIGGLAVGLLENLAGGLIDSRAAEITPYIILLLVLLFRPTGLFGLKRLERI